ncbi:MAG TPA: stage III sporulation protein AF [Bacillales bacterium]
MDYLTSWISEIILLILMAVVLELLLPNSSLQRYVRMVVGLLLLLALLKPVLSVFDTNVNEMFASFSASSVVNDGQIKNSMKNMKKEIQASNRAYIEDKMAVRIKSQIEKEVSDRFHLDVAEVNVDLMPVESDGDSPVSLKHISIILAENQNDGAEDKVKPVEPVTVDVTESSVEPSVSDGRQKKIRRFLADKWRIPPKKITVVLEGGANADNE